MCISHQMRDLSEVLEFISLPGMFFLKQFIQTMFFFEAGACFNISHMDRKNFAFQTQTGGLGHFKGPTKNTEF